MISSVGSVEREACLCCSTTGGGGLEAFEKPRDIPKWSGSAWSIVNSSLCTSLDLLPITSDLVWIKN